MSVLEDAMAMTRFTAGRHTALRKALLEWDEAADPFPDTADILDCMALLYLAAEIHMGRRGMSPDGVDRHRLALVAAAALSDEATRMLSERN